MVAIREAKDLNKISLDEICGSLFTYVQEVNQIDEEENKELVEKKKGLALKTNSRNEEQYEDSCENEDAKMVMLARKYKKLAFQRDQWMGKRNFRKDWFRNEPSRNYQITCYGCKQLRHVRSECPMNKESKKDKDKKKKKAMMVTWFDSDPFSFGSEQEMEIKANLCLMAIKDEVCIDDFDEFDKLQNEYECLFNDKYYKKIITALIFYVEKAKHDYDVVIDNKNELKKCFDDLKSENEALRLEL